jgi:serine/threonine protein kinase
MITGKPLFFGNRTIKDQLESIFKFIKIESKSDFEELSNLPKWDSSLSSLELKENFNFYSQFSKEALDLFQKMFRLNPTTRISSFEALFHHYFNDVKLPSFLNKISKTELKF